MRIPDITRKSKKKKKKTQGHEVLRRRKEKKKKKKAAVSEAEENKKKVLTTDKEPCCRNIEGPLYRVNIYVVGIYFNSFFKFFWGESLVPVAWCLVRKGKLFFWIWNPPCLWEGIYIWIGMILKGEYNPSVEWVPEWWWDMLKARQRGEGNLDKALRDVFYYYYYYYYYYSSNKMKYSHWLLSARHVTGQ